MARKNAQVALFELLQRAEQAGRPLTEQDILRVTRWKPDTLDTYVSKGKFGEFLHARSDGSFEVGGTAGISFEEFSQRLTQSLHVREIGYYCKSRLAKALLRKSRDNMVLALELYNRPSLDNRLDAFVLLFCAAWEQLLKAILIEAEGEASIFRRTKPGRPRETLSLGDCLDKFECGDHVKRNLTRIKDLRDMATHLTMPELQPIASRLFQAGVLNYAKHFKDFARLPFVPRSTVGLLTLVVDASAPPTVGQLHGAYGPEIGAEILELVDKLSTEIDEANDREFAIPIRYRLVFSDRDSEADISLSRVTGAARDAVIIEKTRDHRETHPYTMTAAITRVMEELKAKLNPEDLDRRLQARDRSNKPTFNSFDHEAILHDTGWKNSNNHYHHKVTDQPPLIRYFSEAYVQEVVDRIVKKPQYLNNARASLSNHRSKTRGKRRSRAEAR